MKYPNEGAILKKVEQTFGKEERKRVQGLLNRCKEMEEEEKRSGKEPIAFIEEE